jgi:threonine dehydrogenase-like Zn-dependent dehydrogenase
MAARAAVLLGAAKVIVIDRIPERLAMAEQVIGAETGMEAHSARRGYPYGQVVQQFRLQTDRPTAVREAIHACRKGAHCSCSACSAAWWTSSRWAARPAVLFAQCRPSGW